MKRLRRFNESVSQIDYDYVYGCFAELIDEGKAEIELIESKDPHITIRLKTQKAEGRFSTTKLKQIENPNSPIHNYINAHNINNELLQDFQVGLNRLAEEYPDYKLQFRDYGDAVEMEIFKNKEEEQYPF